MVKNTKSFADMINAFSEGDIVTSIEHSIFDNFFGVVDEVNPKENKIYVIWSGGKIQQHDPSELALHSSTEDVSRRYRGASAKLFADQNDIHGLKEPVGGGFEIMEDLVDKLHNESMEKAGLQIQSGENLRSRRAVYHRGKGRIYQRSKDEQENSVVLCSKCKTPMDEHGFVRGDKLFICPNCGWKIQKSKIV